MISFIILSLALSCYGYTIKQPTLSLLEPQGIQFAYPDDGGVTLVAYHYNINKPLAGVNAGDYNYDVSTSTNGYFIHDNTNVDVVSGDVVTYWINVITSSGGYLLTDQTWVAPAPTTQPPNTIPPTLPPSTTQAPTATASQTTNGPTQPPQTDAPPQTTVPGSAGSGGNTGNGGSVITTSCSAYPCDASVCDMTKVPCNGLIFEETWEDFDLDRWQHELTMSGGGNWEFQIYSNNRSNSYVRDNTLFIKPTLTADHYGEAFLSSGTVDMWGGSPADICTANSFWGCMRTGSGSNYLNPAKSARIRTVNSFAFKYGRVEIEAKMPTGDWLWPAIWFLPKDQRYGTWPASGEIDLLESRGNTNLKDSQGTSHGNDAFGSTLHWGPYWPVNGYQKTTKEVHGDFATNFHKYGFDWNEDAITFYLDGKEIYKVDPGEEGFWKYGDFDNEAPGSDNPWKGAKNKMTPFDQEFYLVINLAVGGTNGYFPDDWINENGAKPWNNNSPTAMKDFWMAKNTWVKQINEAQYNKSVHFFDNMISTLHIVKRPRGLNDKDLPQTVWSSFSEVKRYPTWQPDVNNGENAALQVKTIRVWAN